MSELETELERMGLPEPGRWIRERIEWLKSQRHQASVIIEVADKLLVDSGLEPRSGAPSVDGAKLIAASTREPLRWGYSRTMPWFIPLRAQSLGYAPDRVTPRRTAKCVHVGFDALSRYKIAIENTEYEQVIWWQWASLGEATVISAQRSSKVHLDRIQWLDESNPDLFLYLTLHDHSPSEPYVTAVALRDGRPRQIRRLRTSGVEDSASATYDAAGKLVELVEDGTGRLRWTSRKLAPAWWKAHEARLVAHCAALAARPDAREILIAISESAGVTFPDFVLRLADGRLVRADPDCYPAVFEEAYGIISASAAKKKMAALWSFTDPRVQVRVIDTENWETVALADEIAMLDD